MNIRIKKYLSLFLLGVFLFAYTEKGVHDLLHMDDVHCNAIDQKHFHNQEHHCYICDFNFSIFDGSASTVPPSFIRCSNNQNFLSFEQRISLQSISASSNRGPPALV